MTAELSKSTSQIPPTHASTASSLLSEIIERWRLLISAPLLVGGITLGITFLIPPVFTAKTTLLPPQQQNSAASALASLGSIAGLPNAAGASRSPIDQYIAFLQSNTIADRVIEQFQLQKLYNTPFKASARKALAANVRVSGGKKDGLISIEVDDTNPQRAADIANRLVDELRVLTGSLALTEAQQRRVFFDGQLRATREQLAKAQIALQGSGFSGDNLKAEPKATAEAFARLKAQVAAAEVRVKTLRTTLAPSAVELQQAESSWMALRQQVAEMGAATTVKAQSGEYIERYREFKYQETLFELLARQLELARADEARDGPLIQVIDKAQTPEVKSRPKRLNAAVTATALTLAALVAGIALLASLGRLPASTKR